MIKRDLTPEFGQLRGSTKELALAKRPRLIWMRTAVLNSNIKRLLLLEQSNEHGSSNDFFQCGICERVDQSKHAEWCSVCSLPVCRGCPLTGALGFSSLLGQPDVRMFLCQVCLNQRGLLERLISRNLTADQKRLFKLYEEGEEVSARLYTLKSQLVGLRAMSDPALAADEKDCLLRLKDLLKDLKVLQSSLIKCSFSGTDTLILSGLDRSWKRIESDFGLVLG